MSESLFSFARWATSGGLIRQGFIGRRPWIFTRRYYSPGGWRTPRFIWSRRWRYNASGKVMSMQLSRLHGVPQALKRFWRLLRSDAACAMCLSPERPWRRMFWYPFDGVATGAYICSDACWDALDERRDGDDDDE